MDLQMFQETRTGELVPIAGVTNSGEPWEHAAFLPQPLGDAPELASAAHRAVAEARAALAALDATAQRLPDPRIFRRQSLRVEAQATAALEGTYEPLAKVLAAAAEPQGQSMTEVLNFVSVADEAFAAIEAGRVPTVSLMANLQGALMRGTKAEGDNSGRIRPIQVVVGRREEAPAGQLPVKAARYVPPPPGSDLEARVRDLLDWMAVDHRETMDPITAAAMAHYQFEALHPFHDGNGRLGRLLIVLHLQMSGLLGEPTLTVSPWFEQRRTRYYDALFGVSAKGDWSTWVQFFAEGLADSAKETKARMLAVADAQDSLKSQIRAAGMRTSNAYDLVDFAVEKLVFTTAEAAQATGMGVQGASKRIESLVGIGVLAAVDERKYNRLFFAPKIFDVYVGGTS